MVEFVIFILVLGYLGTKMNEARSRDQDRDAEAAAAAARAFAEAISARAK